MLFRSSMELTAPLLQMHRFRDGDGKPSHLFIFNLQCGQAGLQLVVAHQQLRLDRLLCTELTHLRRGKDKGRHRMNLRPGGRDNGAALWTVTSSPMCG